MKSMDGSAGSKIVGIGAGAVIVYGMALLVPYIIPLGVVAFVFAGMARFASVNDKERKERLSLKGDRRSGTIDADEIILPQRKRKTSYSNETIDMPTSDISKERQIMMAKMKAAKLEAQLAKTRSAVRTMENS